MLEIIEKAIEVENKILSKFERSLSSSKYSLTRHFRFINKESTSFEIDGLIKTEEGYPYVVIEVKIKANPNDSRVKQRLVDYLFFTQSKYGILIDEESCYLLDSKNLKFEKFNYDDLIKKIFRLDSNSHKKEICDYL